jgi:hypothetical protein
VVGADRPRSDAAGPSAPGYSIEMQLESLDRYELPQGVAWSGTPAVFGD